MESYAGIEFDPLLVDAIIKTYQELEPSVKMTRYRALERLYSAYSNWVSGSTADNRFETNPEYAVAYTVWDARDVVLAVGRTSNNKENI